MSNNPYLIDQTLSDFLESDVAILVASCDEANKPIITRGFGARVSDDCAQVTVFVTDEQSAGLLGNIKQTGRLSFNAARVTNYESYQIKGSEAQICDLTVKDERHVSQYVDDMKAEFAKVGVTAEQAEALFQSRHNSKLVGIKLSVEGVYCQTPGPGAGGKREPVS